MKTEVIKIEVNTESAKKGFNDINAVIKEQKQITIEFKKELIELERQLRETPKTALAAQKQLKDRIVGLKDAIKDQNISLQELNITKSNQTANKIATAGAEKLGKTLDTNKGFLSALNKLTGGLSNQVLGVAKQFSAAAKATKIFINTLSGMQKALLTTGIGAIVVALGTIIAYWDDIKSAVSGVSIETSKLVKSQERSVSEAERQVSLATSQDNILKQQGLSEIDIINYKREQTAELIKQIRLQIELNKQATEEAAKSAAKWQGALNTIGLGSIAGFLGVDSSEIATEGNKANQELEDKLNTLLNTQAGYYQSTAELKEQEILKGLVDSERLAEEAKKLNEDFFKEFGITSAQAYLDSFNSTVKDKLKEDQELFSMFNKLEGLENSEFDAQFDADMEKINARKKAEIDSERQIRDAKLETLDTVRGILGEETAISKAAFAIKQLLALKELQLSFLKMKAKAAETVTNASLDVAEGGVSVSKGAAKAAATLNPFVIASYAASAIAIVASMVSAFSKAKNVASSIPGGGGGGTASAPQVQIPDFNIVGQGQTNQLAEAIGLQEKQPIKAYVVSNDVTSAQSLERNIVSSATI